MILFFLERSTNQFDGNDGEIRACLCRKRKIIIWIHRKTHSNGTTQSKD